MAKSLYDEASPSALIEQLDYSCPHLKYRSTTVILTMEMKKEGVGRNKRQVGVGVAAIKKENETKLTMLKYC